MLWSDYKMHPNDRHILCSMSGSNLRTIGTVLCVRIKPKHDWHTVLCVRIKPKNDWHTVLCVRMKLENDWHTVIWVRIKLQNCITL